MRKEEGHSRVPRTQRIKEIKSVRAKTIRAFRLAGYLSRPGDSASCVLRCLGNGPSDLYVFGGEARFSWGEVPRQRMVRDRGIWQSQHTGACYPRAGGRRALRPPVRRLSSTSEGPEMCTRFFFTFFYFGSPNRCLNTLT